MTRSSVHVRKRDKLLLVYSLGCTPLVQFTYTLAEAHGTTDQIVRAESARESGTTHAQNLIMET